MNICTICTGDTGPVKNMSLSGMNIMNYLYDNFLYFFPFCTEGIDVPYAIY